MKFRKLGPIILTNNLPLNYAKELTGNLGYELQIALPGTANPQVLHLKVKIRVLFREAGKTSAPFLFETQTDFFCPPIADAQQRDSYIELYVLNAISDFISVFNDLHRKSDTSLYFNRIDLGGIKKHIEEAVLRSGPY